MMSLVSEWIALSVWIGGLIVLVAAVLPAVFNIFGGQDAGGLFLTRAFEGYNRLVVGAMVVLAAGMGWRAWYAPSAYAVSPAEAWIYTVMVVIAGIIILYLHPLAAVRQADAFALKTGEGRKEALEAFFQLHMPIRTLYMINLALGIILAGVRVRTWISRTERAL
jgi:uncharacterized membrane protein